VKGVCKYCKSQFSYKGAGASTGAMWRHIDGCMKKKLHEGTMNTLFCTLLVFLFE
jgi:hypothetical protein